jgi:TonB family protein
MRIPRSLFSRLLIASALSLIAVSVARPQVSDGSPKPAPFFLNLHPPAYPPLARQARISGDIVLQIGVRPDGSVASAEVISGHAMLKQSALESARKSTVLPQQSKEPTLYSLTYTFGLRADPGAGCTDGAVFVRVAKMSLLVEVRVAQRSRHCTRDWPVARPSYNSCPVSVRRSYGVPFRVSSTSSRIDSVRAGRI